MYPKKKITDEYFFVSDNDTELGIYAHFTWPYMNFKKEPGILSAYAFHEEIQSGTAAISFRNGHALGASIYDLSPVEIVNFHQWHGTDPIDIKDGQTGVQKHKEPPLWQSVTVDNATGERIVLMNSHGLKDDLFRATTRLNTLLDYSRDLLSPWRPLIDAGEDIPVDEIRAALEDHPPRFKFVTEKKREQAVDDIEKITEEQTKNEPKPEGPRYGLAISVVLGLLLLLAIVSTG